MLHRSALNEAGRREDRAGGHTVRVAASIDGRPFVTYRRRRAARGHADRLDGLQPVGPGPDRSRPAAAGHRPHPGLAPHALRPAAGPRPGRSGSVSRCSARARPSWSSTACTVATLEPGADRALPGGRPAGPAGDLRRPGLPRHPAGQVPPGRPLGTAPGSHAGRAAGARPRGHRRRDRRPRPGHDRADRRDRCRQDPARRGPRASCSAGGPTRPGAARCRRGPGRGPVRRPTDDDEVVLARAWSPRRDGPGRGSTGAWPPSARWPRSARGLVDLHGQHAHQSLLDPPPNARRSTPSAASISRAEVDGGPAPAARARRELGRPRRRRPARAREVDLLRYQLDEIDGAGLDDRRRGRRRSRPRRSAWPRPPPTAQAAAGALAALGGATTAVRSTGWREAGRLRWRWPTGPAGRACTSASEPSQAELADAGTELRTRGRDLGGRPRAARRDRARRQLLARAARASTATTLAEVLAFREEARAAAGPSSRPHDERAAALERGPARPPRRRWRRPRPRSGRPAGRPRPAGAADRAALRELAMPWARFEVEVGADRAGDARHLPARRQSRASRSCPLAKVASGGELARAMLAVRLVLTGGGTEPTAPSPWSSTRSTPASAARRPSPVGRALAELGPAPPGPGRHPPGPGGGLRRPAAGRAQGRRRAAAPVAEVDDARRPRTGWSSCPGCCRASPTAARPGATPRSLLAHGRRRPAGHGARRGPDGRPPVAVPGVVTVTSADR